MCFRSLQLLGLASCVLFFMMFHAILQGPDVGCYLITLIHKFHCHIESFGLSLTDDRGRYHTQNNYVQSPKVMTNIPLIRKCNHFCSL